MQLFWINILRLEHTSFCKGNSIECKNNRGISLFSVPGKVYGRILIERVIENSEELVGEEQSVFRKG